MTMTTANCPHCDCEYRMERGDEIKTNACRGCGEELCEECAQFMCAGCDELHCAEHKIVYDGEHACPDCAAFWAQQDVEKLRRLLEERMEVRLERADAAMKAWRATAAANPCPLFVEKEIV